VSVRFVITASGNVGAVTVQTGSGSALDQCVAGALRNRVFPAPQGGGIVIVSYPFVFQPK
jgi:TonB family protein